MQQSKQRIITAIIVIPIFLLIIYFGGWLLAGLLGALSILGCWEYYRIVRTFPLDSQGVWLILGFAYILLGFLSFYGVRIQEGVLWLLLIIWITDSSAYYIGLRFGKTPLAPAISPKKTWEGVAAGLGGGLLIGILYGVLIMDASIVASIIISLVISIVGQIGDLLESKVKRMAGIKDSGRLLPGHGGVLDRFDSLLLASPVMYILILIFI